MKKQFVKITKKITGYYAYGKLCFQPDSIFEFEYIRDGYIRFKEVGQETYFTISLALHSDSLEVVDVLNYGDRCQLICDLKQRDEYSANLKKSYKAKMEVIYRYIDQLPRYEDVVKR